MCACLVITCAVCAFGAHGEEARWDTRWSALQLREGTREKVRGLNALSVQAPDDHDGLDDW